MFRQAGELKRVGGKKKANCVECSLDIVATEWNIDSLVKTWLEKKKYWETRNDNTFFV